MPELIEVEAYRGLAERIVGRTVARAEALDGWYLRGDRDPRDVGRALRGRVVQAARRTGKVLFLDTDGPTVALRFGMTGRLVLDGAGPIDRLEYASGRDDPAWIRFRLRFVEGGALWISDPRRLGSVELDADEDVLGPDAASVSRADLGRILAGSRTALKARLLDQGRIAGIGNLLADEALWRAGIDPARPAGSLSGPELGRLHRHLAATIGQLTERGGSHTGDLHVARVPGATCPRDGAVLLRRTIGGRTTYSCPRHQR
ncbi:MAG: Fpg/Nei family DNA glycosylase [Acidimicrobiia bacterium]